jgi:hypothetical protein
MGSTPDTDAHAHSHGSLENPDVAHEHSDISIRGIVWFLAMLVMIVLATDVAMWGLFKGLDKLEQGNDPFVTPLAAAPGQLPAEPRLQTTPWHDLSEFRTEEQKYIHAYGWIDQRAGIGHLPIERAKELLLQHGLPSRSNASPDATEGTHVAASGEATGGRNIKASGSEGASGSGPQAPGASGSGPRAPGASGQGPRKPGA